MRLSLIRLLPRVQTHHQRHDDTHAAIACDMLNPAQCPEHALMARIPLGLGPSLHQLRSRSLCLVRRLHSYYGRVRLLVPVHHRLRLLAFPMRTAVLMTCTHCRRSDPRYPRFRRDLFARDVALDPGGTTMPRITALHMLRSTMRTVSAPASSSFRGSLPHPTQPLCTLRVRRHRRLTQHSLPGGSLGLTWAGLAPADRASFAWRLLSFRPPRIAVSPVQRNTLAVTVLLILYQQIWFRRPSAHHLFAPDTPLHSWSCS